MMRLESDSEHSQGVKILADLIHWFFPKILPYAVWRRVVDAASYHDIGETETGDILDDGTTPLKEKIRREAAVVKKYFADIPNADAVRRVICRSEYMKGVPYEEVCDRGVMLRAAWWLKGLDKAEAVLECGRYRKMNVGGRIGYKINPSERDLAVVEELGTDDIVFVWAWSSARVGVQDTILWQVILAMISDVYADVPDEIPAQFKLQV